MSGDDVDRPAVARRRMSPRSPRSTAITCCTGWPRSRRCRHRRTRSARRRDEILARGLPYLVGERAGRVVGYCYAGPFRTRSAYRFTLEDSIYIDPAEVGRGIGRRLLRPLIEQCAERGYRQMVAVIGGSETVASIRLHRALGFVPIGVLPAIGFKFGRWIDTVLMQRALGPGADTPARVTVSSSSRRQNGSVICRSRPDPRFHAHIYYDPGTKPVAETPAGGDRRRDSRSNSAAGMTSRSGRIRSRCIRSPLRPRSSAALVPWLMLNRGGLDVLVHPQTGDAYADHTEHACWLGAPLPLRLEVLRRNRGRLKPAARPAGRDAAHISSSDDQDDQDDADAAARVIAPTAAVRPCRQRADQRAGSG